MRRVGGARADASRPRVPPRHTLGTYLHLPSTSGACAPGHALPARVKHAASQAHPWPGGASGKTAKTPNVALDLFSLRLFQPLALSQQQRSPFHSLDDFSEDEEEERITLFTADGLVVLPSGRRRARPAGARHGRRRASTPQQPHPTLPPTWDRPPPPDLLAWAATIQDDPLTFTPLPSWSEGGLCLASPFLCRAATAGDGGPDAPGARRVSLHGWTRCPASFAHTVAAVATALRGAVLDTESLPPPPGGLAPPGTAISLTLPLLHGVPPALDALVAAIATAPGGRHVIERVTREWVVLPGRRVRG